MTPRLMLVIIATMLLGAGATALFYYGVYVVESRELPYDFRIEPGVAGLNVDADRLHFGTVPVGGTASRIVTVTSPRDARLSVSFRGACADLLSATPAAALVKRGEPLGVTTLVTVPARYPVSGCTGDVLFSFYRW